MNLKVYIYIYSINWHTFIYNSNNNNFISQSILATTEDCQLLEKMNKTTKDKYADMSQMGQRLMKEMSRLQNTCMLYILIGDNYIYI